MKESLTFVFATHNAHKVREVSRIITHKSVTLHSLSDIDYQDEIVEDGSTLAENAWIKATTLYRKLRVPIVAEDTGLEVFSLDMQPGIYSARYAGPQRNDHDNINKLLKTLEGSDHRKAQFRTVVAVYLGRKRFQFEGVVRGRIATAPSGTNGFGYDPIFIPDGYEHSFGVLSDEIKAQISHRSRAFHSLGQFLSGYNRSI